MAETTLKVGDRVCRKGLHRRVTGTVVAVAGDAARVRWDRTEAGLVRIGNGRGLTTTLRAAELVPAVAFVARPLDRPADDAYRVTDYRVDVDRHPSGRAVSEYGVNAWWLGADGGEEAVRIAAGQAVALAGTGVRIVVRCREEAEHVPAGCRKARTFSRWVVVSEVVA